MDASTWARSSSIARARAAGLDLGVEQRERELRTARRELELDERLEQPRIARLALARGEQRRLRRRVVRPALAARELDRGVRRSIRPGEQLLEHGASGVGIAELVEGSRAAHLVARREPAAAAREHAVVDEHLSPVLRVVVDARLDPVELDESGASAMARSIAATAAGRSPSRCSARASRRWFSALSWIFTSSRRIAAASAKRPSASASRASADRVIGSSGNASDSSANLARASASWSPRIWSSISCSQSGGGGTPRPSVLRR